MSTNPTDPPALASSGRGKLKLPDNFEGDRTQSQKFIMNCLLLFTAEPDRYKTDSDKVSLALSCMRYGTAGVWAESFLKRTVGATPPQTVGTWDDFHNRFKLQFKETNLTDKARSALMSFSQGKMTVDEYSNQFILIAADADITDKEQVPYFQRGLDPRVMDKIYDKETPPKDTIQDWVNTACEIDGRLRARSAQKAILANSTSFRSDFLNRFHLQPARRYNSTTAPRRMNNQVVDMDIDASRKRDAARQKRTHDGKLTTRCFNCGKSGHWASDCRSPRRGVPPSRGNPRKPMGGGGRRTRATDMEDEDEQEPPLGNDAGLHRGLEEGSSHGQHRRLSQPGNSVEREDPSARRGGSRQSNGEHYIPPDRRQSNGPISDTNGVRALFQEVGKAKAREMLVDLAEDFS